MAEEAKQTEAVRKHAELIGRIDDFDEFERWLEEQGK